MRLARVFLFSCACFCSPTQGRNYLSCFFVFVLHASLAGGGMGRHKVEMEVRLDDGYGSASVCSAIFDAIWTP